MDVKRLLVLAIACTFFAGCVLPYKSATFRQIQTTSTLIDSATEMGAALTRADAIPVITAVQLREALTELVRAHDIATYALEQYMIQGGVLGYSSLESELNNLYNKSQDVLAIINRGIKDK